MTNDSARLRLAARRLALYADMCAGILKERGYVGKGQSLEAKIRDVMDALHELGPNLKEAA